MALNAGYTCCQQLDVCDSTISAKNGVIRDLQKQLINTEFKYGLKHGNFITADSAYKAAAIHLNECNYETQRLKKGKRNWQILTILTGAALAGFIIIK